MSKGDHNGAIADYTSAIRIDPRNSFAYYGRAVVRHDLKNFTGAMADYRKAIILDPEYPDPYNALAWLLATSSRPQIRNGNQAVRYALKASELTEWKKPEYVDTLAAAYAEGG